MKACFTLMIAFLLIGANSPDKRKKDLYVIDFHNEKEFNSLLGMKIADEFEASINFCNSRYKIVPRTNYQEELEGKTFEWTKHFLREEGVDYIIYGDVFFK